MAVISVSQTQRKNFLHLYLDIAWYGILVGSSLAFLSVYLVRIGANGLQIGLLSAIPAVVTLGVALPAGQWLKTRPIDDAVFWTSVIFRLGYAAWIPLPVLLPDAHQVWAVLLVTLVLGVPGTALAVGFNALYAEAVPPERRGHVTGVRNALLAVTSTATSLLCGYLLERTAFPLGYQIVFALGFLGAGMSSVHLRMVHIPHPAGVPPLGNGRSTGDQAQPGLMRMAGDVLRGGVGLRFLMRLKELQLPRFSLLRGPFGVVLGILFLFHFMQHLAIPVFPLYWVGELGLSDQTISMGNALFYLFVFLGSLQLARWVERFGNHRVLVAGVMAMSTYPGLMALAQNQVMFLAASVTGGLAWALAGGALANYLLEKIPTGQRPTYLAWYMLALNVAVLLGSLLGPVVARGVGLAWGLGLFAVGRLISGLVLWRYG